MKAIITGGSRGIGRAIAEEMADAGYSVLLVAREGSRLERTAKEIQASTHVATDYFICDLQNLADIDSLFEYCKRRKFLPNLLIHSAGIFLEGSLTQSRIEDYDETMAVNIRGTYYLTKTFIPILEKQNNPHIVIIGSTAGLESYATGAIYGVSKWATRGYAINLREELKGCGIAVTLISPGGTWTDLWEGVDLPGDRLMPPKDIGKLVRVAVSLSKQTVVEEIVVRPILGDLHD